MWQEHILESSLRKFGKITQGTSAFVRFSLVRYNKRIDEIVSEVSFECSFEWDKES